MPVEVIKNRNETNSPISTIGRIGGTVGGDILFVAVSDRQQHFFCIVQIAALFAVVFEDIGFYDRIHWAGLFTKSTEEALGQIDVIPRNTTTANNTQNRHEQENKHQTHSNTQKASKAALFA